MYRIIFRLYVWGRESNLQYNNKQKLQQQQFILQILFALLFIFKHQITTILPLKKIRTSSLSFKKDKKSSKTEILC